jgi:1,4-alpha-glucan branching enzyme
MSVKIDVKFTLYTGIRRAVFRNARLVGSWNAQGAYAAEWNATPMHAVICEDGCPGFETTIAFDAQHIGSRYRWGVMVDGPSGKDQWAICTEVGDHRRTCRYRAFDLKSCVGNELQHEHYYLTSGRRLGANKRFRSGNAQPSIEFAVWAPYAHKVEVVFGGEECGYIAGDGSGIDPKMPVLPMTKDEHGVWHTDPAKSPELSDFNRFLHSPYMFRITKAGGRVAYRTDLYSRSQIGQGKNNPNGAPYDGCCHELDGTVSCSVVNDPDSISSGIDTLHCLTDNSIPEAEFWRAEFSQLANIPRRVEDLVIYEMHVGALWNGEERPGSICDAIRLLDYLVDLGVNAVELLPMAEFRGWVNWGYATSHYFAIESSSGGGDQLKHFVRECHRRGIAVIMDVVYNHYSPDAERAEWMYDSDSDEQNSYYWYEGPSPTGSYVDNYSTGFAPRYWEEMVRQLFISSAVALVEEYHIDGFRVDQTSSIREYNVLDSNGAALPHANAFGAKFLRELSRTLKLIKPGVILTAEDHGADKETAVTPVDQGGLGFDAAWYADFYHHLAGDGRRGPEYARLLKTAGLGGDAPLAMDYFAGALARTGQGTVVYHESHDEAGNAEFSRRTIVTAVDGSPLIGETRWYAEARCRFAFGMAMLAAGTPMFLMGEEVGASKDYRYDTFLDNRENLRELRSGDGKRLFEFYRDLIALRRSNAAIRSRNIDVVYVNNATRILAFRRWHEGQQLLVVASLNNRPFDNGYHVWSDRLSNGAWRTVFTSDQRRYGGDGIGAGDGVLNASDSTLDVKIPRAGFVILEKV